MARTSPYHQAHQRAGGQQRSGVGDPLGRWGRGSATSSTVGARASDDGPLALRGAQPPAAPRAGRCRRGRPATRLEDQVQVVVGDGPVGEGPGRTAAAHDGQQTGAQVVRTASRLGTSSSPWAGVTTTSSCSATSARSPGTGGDPAGVVAHREHAPVDLLFELDGRAGHPGGLDHLEEAKHRLGVHGAVRGLDLWGFGGAPSRCVGGHRFTATAAARSLSGTSSRVTRWEMAASMSRRPEAARSNTAAMVVLGGRRRSPMTEYSGQGEQGLGVGDGWESQGPTPTSTRRPAGSSAEAPQGGCGRGGPRTRAPPRGPAGRWRCAPRRPRRWRGRRRGRAPWPRAPACRARSSRRRRGRCRRPPPGPAPSRAGQDHRPSSRAHRRRSPPPARPGAAGPGRPSTW